MSTADRVLGMPPESINKMNQGKAYFPKGAILLFGQQVRHREGIEDSGSSPLWRIERIDVLATSEEENSTRNE